MTVAIILISGAAILWTFIFAAACFGVIAYIVYCTPKFLTQTHTGNNYGQAVLVLLLLIAFVFLGATESYSTAKSAVQTEAGFVEYLFELGDYLMEPDREHLQHATVCYARAVAGPEWLTMADGESSSVPSNWTGTGNHGIRATLKDLGPDHHLFSMIAFADAKRSDARRVRLTESNPAIPPILIGFMLAGMATMIVFLAVASPRGSPFHIAAFISAATLVCAIGLILALDRPFSGAISIAPTQMQITADDFAANFVERYGKASIRCDADGNPKS